MLNLGNMHALAFHLRGTRIISLYEHHTGETGRASRSITSASGWSRGRCRTRRCSPARATACSTRPPESRDPFVAVTGPQREKLRGSRLNPYFAAPHGDMMLSGCFGLVQAFAARYPEHREEIERALKGQG